MRKILYLSIAALTLSLSACYYDTEEELYPNSFSGNTDTANVTYSGTIAPLLAANCNSCHSSGGSSPDLTTYANVFASKALIKARAIDGSPSPMPSSGLMSLSNRNKLAAWIAAGALNN
jgi:hypothetical protein